MNREEILAKSRNENKNQDEMQRDALAKAGQCACMAGGIVCGVILLLEAVLTDFSGRVSLAVWSVYLAMTGTMLLVKFTRLHKRHELAFGLLQLALASFNPGHLAVRIPLFIGGTVLVGLSVALFFNTYLAPTVYDLFVKVLCARYRFSVRITKTVFDCCMLVISVVLAIFVYGVFGEGDLRSFGGFVGVIRDGGVFIGTLITVCVNGLIISFFDKLLKKYISFETKIPKLYQLLDFSHMENNMEREAE